MRFFKSKAAENAEIEETVCDFTLRTPYWSYRAVPYRSYAPLDGFQAELDTRLEALFSGEVDAGIGNVLDTLIFDVVRAACINLEEQRTSHQDTIVSLGLRPAGDLSQFQAQLANLKTALEENQKKQAFDMKLLQHDDYKEEW